MTLPLTLDRIGFRLKSRVWSEALARKIVSECGGTIIACQCGPRRRVYVQVDLAKAADVFRKYEAHPDVDSSSVGFLPVDALSPPKWEAAVPYHDVNAGNPTLPFDLFAFGRMDVFNAWKYTRGEDAPVIGVVDSGPQGPWPDADPRQGNVSLFPEFAGKTLTFAKNPDMPPGNDALYGYPSIASYHGVAVASVIVGNRTNDNGVCGIAPDAPLLACVRGTWLNSSGVETGSPTSAVYAALDLGAKIINCSWFETSGENTYFLTTIPGQDVKDMLDAVAAAGAVIVFAATNSAFDDEETNVWSQPASLAATYDNAVVVAVSQYGDLDRAATYSAHGVSQHVVAPGHYKMGAMHRSVPFAHYDVAGPGVGWISPNKRWRIDGSNNWVVEAIQFNGTSCAAPVVSGVLALIWSANPLLTNIQVRDILLSTMTKGQHPEFYDAFRMPASVLPSGWSFPGTGVPNAAKGVKKALSLANPGTIYPHLGFVAQSHPNGIRTAIELEMVAGVATTHLRGTIIAEATAFCTDAITRIQVLAGATVLYDSNIDPAPICRTTWDTPLELDAADLVGKNIIIKAWTAGSYAEQEYADIVGHA